MTSSDDRARLRRTLDRAAREDEQLRAVRQRLFADVETIDREWVVQTIATPAGIDRLESFRAKHSRMQDIVVDKLLPRLLVAAGELPGTALDNLRWAERLAFLQDADRWIAMRRYQHLLVVEYVDDPAEMVPALLEARLFVDELHITYMAIKAYATSRLLD